MENNNIDNSDVDQGYEQGSYTDPQMNKQIPRASSNNLATNAVSSFADGVKTGFNGGPDNPNNSLPGKSSPALGQRKMNNHPDLNDKKHNNDNNSTNNGINNSNVDGNNQSFPDKQSNGMPGSSVGKPNNQNNKSGNNNDKKQSSLPGTNLNKDKKPVSSNNNSNNKPSLGKNDSEGFNPRKALESFSPLGAAKSLASRMGLGKKKDDDESNNSASSGNGNSSLGDKLKAGASDGLKSLWIVMPLPMKIAVASSFGIILFIFLVAMVIFGGTTAAVVSSICDEDSNSSGSGYTGSADVMEFMCKMQSPLGGRSYPLCGFVGEDRGDHIHAGVDLSIGTGVPVYAAQAGTVVRAEVFYGYGNCIDIDHGNGLVTRYAHLSAFKVKKGDKVAKGEHIGTEGNTGGIYPVHLHFELRKNDEPQTAINHYFNYYDSLSNSGDCFINSTNVSKKFKKECGSSWDGEPTGDSAGVANSDDDTINISSDSYEDNEDKVCCDPTSSSSSSSSSEYCPNGVTVTATSEGGGGTFELEDYISKVTTRENGGASYEALKAQAIAARTYLVNTTNNCNKTIANSQGNQTMASKATENAKKATDETAGQVMLYDGKVMFSEYSSFLGNCDNKTCTSTFTKQPSGEKATFSMPIGYLSSNNGHGRGMSQNGADYMGSQGKTYDEILRFFYDDKIEITGASSSNTCSLEGDSYKGDIYKFYQIDYPNASYGSYGTIATHGCGTTAMAMVVSTYLKAKHDPVELTKYACSNGYCSDAGTSHAFFEAAAKKYKLGVDVKVTSKSDDILAYLNKGNTLVIALVGNGTFSQSGSGHFILLSGSSDGDVMVHDPASKKRTKTYNFKSAISSEALKYWIFTPGKST